MSSQNVTVTRQEETGRQLPQPGPLAEGLGGGTRPVKQQQFGHGTELRRKDGRMENFNAHVKGDQTFQINQNTPGKWPKCIFCNVWYRSWDKS